MFFSVNVFLRECQWRTCFVVWGKFVVWGPCPVVDPASHHDGAILKKIFFKIIGQVFALRKFVVECFIVLPSSESL